MSKTPIQNRYEFVYLFDVKDGNPNGDPDAGNQPRVDPETLHGLVTDVSLKRKVRNYVTLAKGASAPFDIYIKEKAVLEETHEKAYLELNLELPKSKAKSEDAPEDEKKGKKKDEPKRTGGKENVERAREWMCQNFYDVRAFGAVMALKVNAGIVRGPIQLTFARSLDPIVQLEHSITRMAVATRAESEKQDGDNRTMGRKHTIPYGLYRAHGFISAHYAASTGFDDGDLALFWDALKGMFDHDRSAARGEMNCRGLYVFKHVSKDANQAKLGMAPAHKLFDAIQVKRSTTNETPARAFSDYSVQIAAIPDGVELSQLV